MCSLRTEALTYEATQRNLMYFSSIRWRNVHIMEKYIDKQNYVSTNMNMQ